jgi:hypothetical protein
MYVCDFYQTLSVKGGYKGSSSVYITYIDEEIVCQKYYCLSYLYTSYSIIGPLDRVKLSANGIIIWVIIFDNLLRIKKKLSLQGWHIHLSWNWYDSYETKKLTQINS